MNLRWTEEEEIFAKSVGEFLSRECPPKKLREWEADPLGYSKDMCKRMAEAGWTAVQLPSEVGGLGLPFDYLTILFHQVGRFLPPGPLWETIVSSLLLQSTKGNAQRNDLLGRIARGEAWCSLTLHSSTSSTTGKPPRITGEWPFVPFATDSDYLLSIDRRNGSSTVALLPIASTGVQFESVEATSGERLFHVRARKTKLWGNGPMAISPRALTDVLHKGEILAAAYLLGLSERALEIAAEYAKQRVQFGRPIGSFQAVQYLIADVRVKTEGLRLLVYEASWAASTGQSLDRLAPMAKYWANSTAYTATKNAHQVLGGFGVMAETDLQLYYRRAKGWMINKGDDMDMLDQVAQSL